MPTSNSRRCCLPCTHRILQLLYRLSSSAFTETTSILVLAMLCLSCVRPIKAAAANSAVSASSCAFIRGSNNGFRIFSTFCCTQRRAALATTGPSVLAPLGVSPSISSAARYNNNYYPTNQHRLYSSTDAVNGDTKRTSDSDSTATAGKQRSSKSSHLKFEDTPLGKNGMHLLDGLDHYTVHCSEDGHPLSVYGIASADPLNVQSNKDPTTSPKKLKPILLLHGRTWSSVPVFHLLGGPKNNNGRHESRSLMEALLAKGLQPYCMDFRGFGGTHPDETGFVEPYRCVQDAETVLQWIRERHGLLKDVHDPPALLGWSQGALVAQLAAQKAHPVLSKVVLYGSIYDPLIRYPREPLYLSNPPNKTIVQNQYDAAIEDFTVEGTIPPEPARLFAEAALISDPVKAAWKNLFQFNNCDPARVHVPCLVVAGDQDPYAPLHVQQELFCNLARASDRTWSILSGSDHACHLLDGRFRLINTVVSFVLNGKRTEQRQNE